jgi:hypothetical protein
VSQTGPECFLFSHRGFLTQKGHLLTERHSYLLRFHYMFTLGFEKRGSDHAGLLALGSFASVKHALMVTQDTLKFANNVTLYTNSNPGLAKLLENEPALMDLGGAVTIDNRPIKQFLDGGSGSNIIIELIDGSQDALDFLVHQPQVGPPPWIVEQLGLELDFMGNIRTNGFFYQTNVQVYLLPETVRRLLRSFQMHF